MHTTQLSRLLLSVFALSVLAGSCGDNPVTPSNSDHAEERGLYLSIDSHVVVKYDSSVVNGNLAVELGDTIGRIDVTFIADDGTTGIPDEDDHRLGWRIADSSVVELQSQAGDPEYSFRLIGRGTGETTIQLTIVHVDHTDFISRPIVVRVGMGDVLTSGMVVRQGGAESARATIDSSSGSLAVDVGGTGATYDVFLITPDGHEVRPADSLYRLVVAVADTTRASAYMEGPTPWSFRLVGHAHGPTSATLSRLYGNHVDFITSPIPLIVNP